MNFCNVCGGVLYANDAAHFCQASIKVDLVNDQKLMLKRIDDLERQLAMANDAAAKGEKARLEAAGMQLTIWELQNVLRRSPCPRPVGDDQSVADCIKNGHCGCDLYSTNNTVWECGGEVVIPWYKRLWWRLVRVWDRICGREAGQA